MMVFFLFVGMVVLWLEYVICIGLMNVDFWVYVEDVEGWLYLLVLIMYD